MGWPRATVSISYERAVTPSALCCYAYAYATVCVPVVRSGSRHSMCCAIMGERTRMCRIYMQTYIHPYMLADVVHILSPINLAYLYES